MNTQKYKDEYLDDLFLQALHPYAKAKSPHDIWDRVQWRVEIGAPSQWQKMLAHFTRPLAFHWPMSHQPFCVAPNRYRPSPFLGVVVKQMFDVKLAS